MREVFKQLITNFHHTEIPVPIKRNLDLPQSLIKMRKACVFIGMRRSGKTWTLYQQMHSLMQQGIKLEQILYIDFTDDRLLSATVKDLQSMLEAYGELYPQHVGSQDVHLFFDEIHEVPHWENFIRRLLDTEKASIYITGSSAKMLSKEIATSLRGRTVVREIFPFSFGEYLHYHSINSDFTRGQVLPPKQQAQIDYHLQNFLQRGGFPEVVRLFGHSTFPAKFPLRLLSSEKIYHEFCELLQGYVESVMYRDIIDRHRIRNISIVKRVLIHCLQNSANLFSVNNIYNFLKNQEYEVSKDLLYNIMRYFEDAYCIFSISIYNFSAKKRELTPKKIYLVDQGLIAAYTVKEAFERAARLETALFVHLRRSNKEVYYYETCGDKAKSGGGRKAGERGKEVDFLTVGHEGKIDLYQVTCNLSDQTTFEREVSALQLAMKELEVKEGTIVTEHEEREINSKDGKILILPLWKVLLGTEKK